jgi:UDP-N-acetylglucosamine:LPS N-acetylglucosamine transferase
MILIKLGFKRKQIEGNTKAIAGAGMGAAGLGLVARSATLPLREKVKLTPGSKRIAIIFPGGSSGSGHKVPAKALAEAYQHKGYQVDYYDIHDYQNPIVRRYISKQYAENVAADPVQQMPTNTEFDFKSKRAPMWKEIEQAKAGKMPNRGLIRSTVGRELWNVASGHSRFIKELRRKPYERIFGMHGTTADALKHTGAPTDIITTDFVQDPFAWKTDAAGKYYVPTEHAKQRFVDVGVHPNKIVTTGSLLVRKELKTPEKLQVPDAIAEIRAKNPKAHITTVIGGGTGIQVDQIGEQAAKYYNKKNPNAHVIVIAGQNDKAANYLHNLKAQGHVPNMTVLGYQSDAVNYMRHSDLVITRPGGSSTAEALHLGTPIVTYNHADVAKDYAHIGSHEHGNVKTLHDEGMSRHFRTAYSPVDTKKITNIAELDTILEDVHKNYDTLKANAMKASEKFTKIRPEKVIMHAVPAMERPLKLRTVGKIGIGLGLAAAGFGALTYKQGREESNKPLLKISADRTNTERAEIASGAALGVGVVASTIFPKLRGGSGRIVGALKATKKLFVDAPVHMLSRGKAGRSIMSSIGIPKAVRFNGEVVDATVRLTPTDIAKRSINTLKEKGTDISALSHTALREQSKTFDMRSTIQILGEKETKARAAGLKKLVGFSHFAPSQAQRFGFVESDIIAPAIQPYLSKIGPLSYYKSEKINSTNKLKTKGLAALDEMDAYWLAAPNKGIRLFEKDLSIPHEEAVRRAKAHYANMPKTKIDEYTKIETDFKTNYDKLLLDIAKAKDSAKIKT